MVHHKLHKLSVSVSVALKRKKGMK
jgi:hypothetical protein